MSAQSRRDAGNARPKKGQGRIHESGGILAIFVCAVSLAACAQSDAEAATKSKIVALKQAWNQAYKSADTKALDALLDKAIVLVNDDGSVQTKAEFLASVKETGSQPSAQQQQGGAGIVQRARVRHHGYRNRRNAG